MTQSLRSLFLFLCLGFSFPLMTVGVFAAYGVSNPMWPSTDIYALIGTRQTTNTEIDHTVYFYATGSSQGLYYDKNNSILTGSIYSSQFGKIDVVDIKIWCPDLTTATAPCYISKTGWWSGVLLSTAIGTLTQTGTSTVNLSTKETANLKFTNIGFTWDLIDLSGIKLLPNPYHITWGEFWTGIYIASWATKIDLQMDSYVETWATLILTPMVGQWIAIPTVYHTDTYSFTWVDLSLAGDYAYTIIDKSLNKSIWSIRSVASTVSSGSTETTIPVTGSETILNHYCRSNPWLTGTYKNVCPDGNTMRTTHLDLISSTQPANNLDGSQVTLSIRDQYGNRIYRQSWWLQMDITRNLTGSGTSPSDIPSEIGGSPAGSISFSNIRIPQPAWSGTTTANITNVDYTTWSWSDLMIQLFSSAPWTLKVNWNVETFDVHVPLIRTSIPSILTISTWDIKFEWLIQDNGLIISPILRNRESVFSHKYLISDSWSISTPHLEYIITTSSGEIVDRIRSAASDTCNILNNTGATDLHNSCWARNRDFSTLSGEISNTLFWTNLPQTNSGTIDIGLTFATGAMTSTGTNTWYLIVMASYEITWAWIIRYPLVKQTFNTAELIGTIPLKILGQIGSSDLGTSMKSLDLLSSNLINTERDKIRKQAQMMRQNFVSHPLVIDDIAIDIPNQVYIVEWDIYINTDIWPPTPQKPKVLIALKNPSTGAGGNIYIKDTVKDIAASLIADGSIFGWDGTAIKPEWVNQLYIRGSIMSNNTIGWAWLSRCPRNTTTCTPTTAINYDFEKIRKLDTGAGWSTTSNAPDASTSFIIEHDPRLVQDSPLVLMRDLTR